MQTFMEREPLVVFVVVVFLLSVQLVGCQDGEIFMLWTSQNRKGESSCQAKIGDPSVYLRKHYNGNFERRDSYDGWTFTAKDKSISYQSLAFDARSGVLAVSEIGRRCIIVANLSEDPSGLEIGRGLELRHFPLSNNISGLALAMNFKLLYWIDFTLRYVGVAELENLHWRKFDPEYPELDAPYSVAVHEAKRYVFWSDIGQRPRITRSDLLGKERRTIRSSHARGKPHSLVVDGGGSRRLYWLEGRLLMSSDFEGSNLISYPINSLEQLTSFVYHEESVIIGTRTGIFLYTLNVSDPTSKLMRYHRKGFTNVRSLSLSRKTAANEVVTNPCSESPGGCTQMCFPKGGRGEEKAEEVVCECEFGFLLDSDGRSCYPGSQPSNGPTDGPRLGTGKILIADGKGGVLYRIDGGSSGGVEAFMSLRPESPEKLAVLPGDEGRDLVLCVVPREEEERGSVIRAYDTSTMNGSLYYEPTGNVTDMVADRTSGALYVSTVGGRVHEVNRFLGVRAVVDRSDEEIECLQLDADNGHLFYGECTTGSIVRIDLSNLSETARYHVGACVVAMAIDSRGVAYIERGGSKVMEYDVEGGAVSEFFSGELELTGLAADESYLYVVEDSRYVTAIDKRSRDTPFQRHVFSEVKDIIFIPDRTPHDTTSNTRPEDLLSFPPSSPLHLSSHPPPPSPPPPTRYPACSEPASEVFSDVRMLMAGIIASAALVLISVVVLVISRRRRKRRMSYTCNKS